MSAVHYSLSSNAYRNNIFTGFSQLQKQEEFVDLTLAADGCMVKVHRSLIALASPYLREVLKTMSNTSPAIFLNNVSHKVLSYLLEYIYQGEVNIPADLVDAFIEVSKSLHIAGVEDLKLPTRTQPPKQKPSEEWPSNNTAHITTGSDDLMQFQENTLLSNLENNAHYETDCSIDQAYQAANIINNAKFIVLNENITNKELVDNVSDVEIKEIKNDTQTNAIPITGKLQSHNILQSQANMSDQLAQVNTEPNQNIPVIEINAADLTDQNKLQINTEQCTDYKIIVKTQIDGKQVPGIEALQNNIPVIEIQHLGLPDQQSQNMTIQGYIPPTQIDTTLQEFQENPTVSTLIQQDHNNRTNKPLIQILDDQIIKAGANIPECNVQFSGAGQVQTSLERNTDAGLFDLKMDALQNMSQFSITERGQIQLILNRYVYCCHHMSRRKRRWRCIEYRKGACPAFVDTMGGAIVARKGTHSHSYHDNKIYKKHKNGLIYQTIELATAARDKRNNEHLKTIPMSTVDDDVA